MLDSAKASETPTYPATGRVLLLTLMGGLLASSVIACFVDARGKTLAAPESRSGLGMPVLAVELPALPTDFQSGRGHQTGSR